MILGQGVRPEGASHVAQAGVPEDQRIKKRRADNDFIRVAKALHVPHAMPDLGQEAVARNAQLDARPRPPSVDVHHPAAAIGYWEHQATLEVLMAERTHQPQPSQPGRIALPAMRWGEGRRFASE